MAVDLRFELEYAARGVSIITLSATLFAIPVYLSLDCVKSTGVPFMFSFGESALPYQPMKKVLK